MKPTQEQALDWAFECDFIESTPAEDVFSSIYVCCPKDIERLVTLAYESGQESMKWDGIHSCHPDCQRPACVHTRKTYQEGYEAGRKDENEAAIEDARTVGGEAGAEMEKLIRARREQ